MAPALLISRCDSGASITLTGTSSDYGGATEILGGTMAVGANVFPGQPGPFGDASGANATVLLGYTSGSSNSALLVTTGGLTFGRTVQLQTGNTGIMTIGGINTSGAVTFSGGYIYLGTSGAAAVPRRLPPRRAERWSSMTRSYGTAGPPARTIR